VSTAGDVRGPCAGADLVRIGDNEPVGPEPERATGTLRGGGGVVAAEMMGQGVPAQGDGQQRGLPAAVAASAAAAAEAST
jgi:hypothetical protein